jgi:hypothetical protein
MDILIACKKYNTRRKTWSGTETYMRFQAVYTMDLYFMHYLTKCSNREKIYGPSDCMQKI